MGFAVKVLVAIHYSVLAAKNWYTRNAVVACQGSMSKVAKSFIFRGCLNPVISAGRTSVDIRASAKLEYTLRPRIILVRGLESNRACLVGGQ